MYLYFPRCCERKQFREGRGFLAHGVEKHSPSGQGVMKQELEPDPVHSQKERARSREAQPPSSFIQFRTQVYGMVSPTLRVGLSTSTNLCGKFLRDMPMVCSCGDSKSH